MAPPKTPTYLLKGLGVAFVAVHLTFLWNCVDEDQQHAARKRKENDTNLRLRIREEIKERKLQEKIALENQEKSRDESDKTV